MANESRETAAVAAHRDNCRDVCNSRVIEGAHYAGWQCSATISVCWIGSNTVMAGGQVIGCLRMYQLQEAAVTRTPAVVDRRGEATLCASLGSRAGPERRKIRRPSRTLPLSTLGIDNHQGKGFGSSPAVRSGWGGRVQAASRIE